MVTLLQTPPPLALVTSCHSQSALFCERVLWTTPKGLLASVGKIFNDLIKNICHLFPKIIYDRKLTTARTSKLLSTHCHNARREHTAMWTPEKTLKILAEKYYRTNVDGDWPDGLKPFLHEGKEIFILRVDTVVALTSLCANIPGFD